jgi:hypothetical protein
MLNLMAPRPGMPCVAAVTPDWSHAVFAYTGYRLVLFRWSPRLKVGSAHIRWREIYEHIPGTRERLMALRLLLSPRGQQAWERAVERWGVDVIAIPGRGTPRWLLDDYRVARARYGGIPVSVVWTDRCARR